MTVTIQSALQRARSEIASASESASLDSQVLLAHVLGVDRTYLLAHSDELLAADHQNTFFDLVRRCAQGEPLAYLIGRRGFYDRDFIVSPSVLVPRPETELLLERALAFARTRPNLTVVDVGTGSGAIAVTVAALCAHATVFAVDVSAAALQIARQNAELHHAPVTLFQGDLLLPIIQQGIRVDLLLANLPYIPSAEVPTLAVSHHEPHLALDGGADGLELVRRLLSQSRICLNPAALTLLEIGAGQGVAVRNAVLDIFPQASVTIQLDYSGLDRIVVVEHK